MMAFDRCWISQCFLGGEVGLLGYIELHLNTSITCADGKDYLVTNYNVSYTYAMVETRPFKVVQIIQLLEKCYGHTDFFESVGARLR